MVKKRVKASCNKAKNVEIKLSKINLSIKDRIAFDSLMPSQNDILSQILARDIIGKIEITQSDVEKTKLRKREDADGFEWDKPLNATFKFTQAEMEFLRTQVTRLDTEKKITPDLLELCLKIREVEKSKNG